MHSALVVHSKRQKPPEQVWFSPQSALVLQFGAGPASTSPLEPPELEVVPPSESPELPELELVFPELEPELVLPELELLTSPELELVLPELEPPRPEEPNPDDDEPPLPEVPPPGELDVHWLPS